MDTAKEIQTAASKNRLRQKYEIPTKTALPIFLFSGFLPKAATPHKLLYLFDNEFWLCIKRPMHIWNDGECYFRWFETTNSENASLVPHETSLAEGILPPTAACFGCVFTLIIRDTDKPQRKILPICRHIHINPISVPGNCDRHVQEIRGDRGRWRWQFDRRRSSNGII